MASRILIAIAALALVAAACGDSGTTTSTAPDETTVAAAGGDAEVAIASNTLGDIVVDADGATLYLFTVDEPGQASNCNDDCAGTWPPLIGAASAGSGIDAALLGTVTRADGSSQATYNGWPLYYFAADAAPGDTNGQGVGDVWWVLDAAGDPVIPTGPSSLGVSDQAGDGTSLTVDSVTLPAPGYVVIHGDGGGSPGPVIGHSDLLPSGESTGVEVTLDEPLAASGTVFPMAHIDADGDGVYEFNPPDETVDVPALFDDGSVAVLPLQVTVEGAEASGDGSVVIAASSLGDILTDAAGNTLYVFTVDTQGEASSCEGTCADNWPALLGAQTAGTGVDGALLGTSTRPDGNDQATYNGWPLYYFAADAAAGDTNGQGVGDVWWVVDAAGNPVQ